MKRLVPVLLMALLVGGMLTGCTSKVAPIGQTDNEILTYRQLDPQKTTLIVSRTGNIFIQHFSEEFERLNPDIQVVCLDITGGNQVVKPMVDWVKNGLAPDIMFSYHDAFTNEELRTYFVNLSTNPVVDLYEAQALNNVASESEIYKLPGPSNVQCLIYNKTLFDQYGWSIPTSFNEFVMLCDQITEDTNGEVEPWNPNAKYFGDFNTAIEGFLYDELFSGVDNQAWYRAVCAGTNEEPISTHLKPLYEAIQTLIDHNILRQEQFSYSATTRGKEFLAGHIAMINSSTTVFDDQPFDFRFMPFPGTTGEIGYINTCYTSELMVTKKEHTDKEKDAINRYLKFFSSVEGQRVFIGETLQISNVKGTPLVTNPSMTALQPAIDEGKMFTSLTFVDHGNHELAAFGKDAKAMTFGEATMEDCLAALDRKTETAEAIQTSKPEIVVTADKDFSILETSFLIADMYRDIAQAQIGLICNNLAYRGNLMRIFSGDLSTSNVNTLMPRSLPNNSTLVKATMTGQQLLDALNEPVGNNETADCIYAFSGLKCEVAPWKPLGERMLSVTLADGTPIQKDQRYTVAFWSDTVFEKYITKITDTYPGTWEELINEKLKEMRTITPATDGRITLRWA